MIKKINKYKILKDCNVMIWLILINIWMIKMSKMMLKNMTIIKI